MRPYLASLGIVLLATTGLSCNKSINATTGDGADGGAARVVDARPGSKVKVEPSHYDFGVMELGQTGEHTFKIINVGEEPLEIKQGSTTCKCTIGGMSAGGKKISKDETLVLKKGESAAIELKWTPKSMSETFGQSATIHTSDPDQPEIQLTINGQVRELISLQPQGEWNVGSLDGDKPGGFKGMIGSAILKEFKIKSIACADPTITATATPMPKEELKASRYKSGYKINVVINRKDVIGRFDEKLTIKTDARDGLTFSPQVSGVRTGPVLIRKAPGVLWNKNSMRLSMGRFSAASGNAVELRLYVGGLGQSELKITKVDKDSDHLQVALHKVEDPQSTSGKNKPDAGRRKIYRLVFSVPPGKEPVSRTGSRGVNVKLHTNHERMKTMSLVVSFNSY
jgi:Protein of unknown function (DUF1573)